MENVEKRTMRKCSSASSLNSHNTTHSLRSYNLNRQKALDKKKDSCNKEHIVSEWKANNLVIEFSTSAYELFKTLLQQNLLSSNTFSLKTTEGLDGQNAKIDTCMKVYNRLRDGSIGKTLKFVINLYHTSSRAVVNGNRVDLFVSDIYTDLCAKLSMQYEGLSVINKGIFDTLEHTCTLQHKEQQNHNDIEILKQNKAKQQHQRNNQINKPCISDSAKETLSFALSDRTNIGTTPSLTHQNNQGIKDINKETLAQESINICVCPLCNQEAGENTIECGQCQEWVHFSCGNISNPLIMNDKEYICPVCSDNLLYASTQTTGISLNEQEQIIDLSSESPQPCVVNRKRSLLDMTLPSSTATDISDGISMGPSPNKQTCPSNNISKDACMQKMPEEAGARSKQKKQQNRQNVKPNRENSLEKAYIGQLESEIGTLRSTLELYQKSHHLKQQKGITIDNPPSEQYHEPSSYVTHSSHYMNLEIKLLEQRMRSMETHITQSMQILQLQQSQMQMQMQAQLQQNLFHMQSNRQPHPMMHTMHPPPYQLPPRPPAQIYMHPVNPYMTNTIHQGQQLNNGIGNMQAHRYPAQQGPQLMNLSHRQYSRPEVVLPHGHINQINTNLDRNTSVHMSNVNQTVKPGVMYLEKKSENINPELFTHQNNRNENLDSMHQTNRSENINHGDRLDKNASSQTKSFKKMDQTEVNVNRSFLENTESVNKALPDQENSVINSQNGQGEIISCVAEIHTRPHSAISDDSCKPQNNYADHFLEIIPSTKKPPELLLIEETISNRE
ncbi:Hypothetical predicted protein [Mytilus galloprovincialis]|uniref:PHD-type domain-containing protein n=1 Tax=Mytilus galloprovincialis TaxID=29158 RepID=A0A8B6HIC7_MYTGA|nr:Hypothetical predicted protein [Mytilus galloprovincialis]